MSYNPQLQVSQDFVLFFNILDEDGSGLLDVGEFLRGMLGEMCEARVGLVTRAWLRMDPAKSGDVSFITLSQFYNPAISLDPRAGIVFTSPARLGILASSIIYTHLVGCSKYGSKTRINSCNFYL